MFNRIYPSLMSATVLGALFFSLSAQSVQALELVMVEQAGCFYCDKWKAEIGPIYPKTDLATAAPLRHIDVKEVKREGITTERAVFFTPTFLLVDDDGKEINRIEGYQSEDFFWALAEQYVSEAQLAEPAVTEDGDDSE